jgi:hypothetical protein
VPVRSATAAEARIASEAGDVGARGIRDEEVDDSKARWEYEQERQGERAGVAFGPKTEFSYTQTNPQGYLRAQQPVAPPQSIFSAVAGVLRPSAFVSSFANYPLPPHPPFPSASCR